MTQFDSDLHALVTGLVLGSLLASVNEGAQFMKSVVPIMDGVDYTNQMVITTNSGKTFTLTVTENA